MGCGVESLCRPVKQDEIDRGETGWVTTAAAAERIKVLERENRELRRANAILKSASASSGQCHSDDAWTGSLVSLVPITSNQPIRITRLPPTPNLDPFCLGKPDHNSHLR